MANPNWSYQEKMITDVLTHVREGIGPDPDMSAGCVLAGGTSSGKTRMALRIVDQLLKDGVIRNALILTHGQKVLRTQMAEEANKLQAAGLLSFTSEVVFSGTVPRESSKVVITLPHSLRNLEGRMPTFDLVVIDEAHHFFSAAMVQKIIHKCSARYTLCLTGTPSKFVASKQFPIVAISVLELLQHNTVCSPAIRLMQSRYDFTQKDYTRHAHQLRQNATFSAEQTTTTLDDVLSVIHEEPHSSDTVPENWESILPAFGKTMIACHSQDQARQVHDYFTSRQLKAALSTSDDDPDDLEIARFKADPEVAVLIVVFRGILGFSCEELVNIVDLTCTQNVDRVVQLFGRILRLHPKPDVKKLFLKAVPHHLIEYNYYLLNFVLSLCDRDQYLTYDGADTIKFRAEKFKGGLLDASDAEASTTRVRKSRPVWKLPTFDILKRLYNDEPDEMLSSYAQTSLEDLLPRHTPAADLVEKCLAVKALNTAPESLSAEEKKQALIWRGTLLYNFRVRSNSEEWLATVTSILGPGFLKVDRRVKQPEDWVPVAERLASENDGVLPAVTWLRKNGYAAMAQMLFRYPELFAHIPRAKLFKQPDEWIPVAERLAREHGGVLPGGGWLQANGYKGLWHAIRRHPELFAHLRQKGRNGKLNAA